MYLHNYVSPFYNSASSSLCLSKVLLHLWMDKFILFYFTGKVIFATKELELIEQRVSVVQNFHGKLKNI